MTGIKATSGYTKPELLMAPFRGITHKSWRNAFARHIGGFDEMFAPFISGAGATKIHPDKLADVMPLNDNLAPTVPQIIGINADEIILLGNTLADLGFEELNWNLGCPFARIANKKRGCGLLPYPDVLNQILEKIFSSIQIKLSIKTRLGYHHADEIQSVIPILNQYPISRVILHPRTGKQGYRGQADPEGYGRVSQLTKHPIIYNGDIYNLSQLRQLQMRFPGQKSWMVGRGALINPFIAKEIKGHTMTDEEKRKQMTAFHFELWHMAWKSQLHESRTLGAMKAIWHYMAGTFANGGEVFTRIKRAKKRETYIDAVDYALQQDFAGETDLEKYFFQLTKIG
jgi:tRNA-dihydrouridine synthase B